LFRSGWFKKLREPRPNPGEAPLRILVLSKFLEDRFPLERLADEHGWELRFINSPQLGFRLLANSVFDVILCDCNQTGYPWREVLDRLSADSPRSCILLISAVNDDYLWGEVIRHGGYDVVTRPLREESLLRAIQAAGRFLAPLSGFPSRFG